MPRPTPIARGLALVTLAGGLVNLVAVLGPSLPERLQRVAPEAPLSFLDVSRYATLLAGFALVVAAVPIARRKRRALHAVLAVALVSAVLHVVREGDFVAAASSLAVAGLLWLARRRFTVGSGRPEWGAIGLRIGAGFLAALGYGALGFWLLDRRDFGIEFHLPDALHRTLLVLSVLGDPGVAPHTRYAHWFLDSLEFMTLLAFGYALWSLFRPVAYRLRVVPHRREAARAILERHGRAATDTFKLWPDKTIELLAGGRAFVAYRVAAGVAVALGDPVGPEEAMDAAVGEFLDAAEAMGWETAFHQTLPDFLPVYRAHGLRKLKIGDEAVVDLAAFTLEGGRMKEVRNRIRRMERDGIRIVRFEPPVPEETLDLLAGVSDAWLTIEGRRERRFTLGRFDRRYLSGTPVLAAIGPDGRGLAFVNVVPSWRPGETTVDLMRHRPDAPNGIMDVLFARLFLQQREAGFTRFNLGIAPMAGFRPEEEPALEERAVHAVIQNLGFLFSFEGLRRFKAKYATSWEPRYLVYESRLELPRLGLALREVSEIPG